jgi:hypothetical protein
MADVTSRLHSLTGIVSSANKTGDGFPSPVSQFSLSPINCLTTYRLLRHLIQFYAVPGVHIFHGENDHAGRRGVSDADDFDLAHRSPR